MRQELVRVRRSSSAVAEIFRPRLFWDLRPPLRRLPASRYFSFPCVAFVFPFAWNLLPLSLPPGSACILAAGRGDTGHALIHAVRAYAQELDCEERKAKPDPLQASLHFRLCCVSWRKGRQ